MPAPSKISQLPEDVRAWLDAELIKRGFGGLVEIEGLLAERGFEIGKSTIGIHSQNLKRKLASIRAATEAARMIAESAPDDADLRSAATMSMVQTDLFGVLVALQEAEDADPAERLKLLSRAAAAIADLSRASVNQKKWHIEMRDRARSVAEEVKSNARAAGMSEETAELWRRKILGIAT